MALSGLERLERLCAAETAALGRDVPQSDPRRGLRVALRVNVQERHAGAWLVWVWLDPGRYQISLSASTGSFQLARCSILVIQFLESTRLLDFGERVDEEDEDADDNDCPGQITIVKDTVANTVQLSIY